ncbi:MAG TPA: Uma2 family endonuclease [Urbifossiella sp.]|nr:Uma2 family endonuclease [Urbifossiella sp.]
MSVLITDPEWGLELRAEREKADGDKWNEVWDGVLVMPSLPNDEHQEIQCRFLVPLALLIEFPKLGKVRAGVNVTDRHPDWKENYRGPDAVVYLTGNPAMNHGSHWVGGPDFLVEIASPGEKPRLKNAFYARVNTREVLVIDRDPWCLELFRLEDGVLRSAGRSDESNPAALVSSTLPLTFRLRPEDPRPVVVVTHPGSGQEWVV